MKRKEKRRRGTGIDCIAVVPQGITATFDEECDRMNMREGESDSRAEGEQIALKKRMKQIKEKRERAKEKKHTVQIREKPDVSPFVFFFLDRTRQQKNT